MLRLLTLALVLGLAAPAGAHDERRIRLEGRTRAALTRALEGARQRLAGPGCAAVLDDFEPDLGLVLSPRLGGLSPSDYLDVVVFGSGATNMTDALAIMGKSKTLQTDFENESGIPYSALVELIEIGAIKFSGTRVIAEYETLINPSRPINQYISNLTGISNAMVMNAPMLSD